MNIKNAFTTGIAISAMMSCSNIGGVEKQPKPLPNIIYILADDLGYGDVGVYGQSKINTPHLDQMAREGKLFTQHYSGSTVCAPSRSALLTGLHTGYTPIRGNKELFPGEGQHPLSDTTRTIAHILKDAGYATGAFGKWGLGFVGTEGDPNNQGFDEFFGYNCQREAHRYYPKHLWHNSNKVILEGNDFTNKVVYAPEVIHGEAMKFIENHKDQPFFMYYPHVIPHAELLVPEGETLEMYRSSFEETPFINQRPGSNYGDEHFDIRYYASQPKPRATFAAMVSLLDKHVGDVFTKLKELGIEENTLVIFTSDNGPHMEGGADPLFFNSNAGLRGKKRDLYEGGIRVPMIAWWPGFIQEGSTSNHISAFWDILPTFAEVVDANAPEYTNGISFLPELLGKEQPEHDYLYWEFHEQGGKQAVRKGKWKAVKLNCFSPNSTRLELYNLEVDKNELNNVAESHPEIVAEMLKIMNEAHTPNPDFPFDGR
jgi:arylsulfatase A-like enzyme